MENLESLNFIYGEIEFRTMAYIIEIIKQIYGEDCLIDGNFLDLGCVIFNFITIGAWARMHSSSIIASI